MRRGMHVMSVTVAYALERVGEGVGDDVGGTPHLAAGYAGRCIHAPFALLEVKTSISYIEAEMCVPLLGRTDAEPIAVEVRHGGRAEVRIIDRSTIERSTATDRLFIRQFVFRADSKAPRVFPFHGLRLCV